MKRIICTISSLIFLILSLQIQVFAEKTQGDIAQDEDVINVNEQSAAYVDDEETDIFESVEEYIPVEDIVLSDFEDEMYVKDTQNLSPTVIPQNASEQNVYYSSSNSTVASVDKVGKVTAVGIGTCRIYVSCDGFSVYYNLRVKAKTESINVKSKFVVIKPDQQFFLEANVHPTEASQELTFKSKDESVAMVSSNGVITAKAIGNTSIIVSNEDATILVNVIVSTNVKDRTYNKSVDDSKSTANKSMDNLVYKIKNSSEKNIVVKDTKIISSVVLKELYGTDKNLIIECAGYDILLKGKDIHNANIEFNTTFNISYVENGLLVSLENDNKLPGTITIKIKDDPTSYKYLYLLDESTQEYYKLNALSNKEFRINSIGKYLVSIKEINHFRINVIWILSTVGVILFLSIIFIFTKKRYWFW